MSSGKHTGSGYLLPRYSSTCVARQYCFLSQVILLFSASFSSSKSGPREVKEEVRKICVCVYKYIHILYIMLVIFSMKIHYIFHFSDSMEVKAVSKSSYNQYRYIHLPQGSFLGAKCLYSFMYPPSTVFFHLKDNQRMATTQLCNFAACYRH